MAYVPFINDYTTPPAPIAAIKARWAARKLQVHNQMTAGNLIMGNLVTECCSDPAFGGQGYYDDAPSDTSTSASIASLFPGTPAASPVAPLAGPSTTTGGPPTVLGYPNGYPPGYPLTPVDILTGTRGFTTRRNGGPWPRPLLPAKYRRRIASAFPNYGSATTAQSLVPPCPCFGSGPPIVIPVPTVAVQPVAAAPTPAPAQNCPYPGCSTGNLCLDLVTGCVSNSQVTQAQVEACTLAGYGTFGNSGSWLSAILLGCGGNLPYLGAPLPNPPQATGAMMTILQAANAAGAAASAKARGVSGFGQTDDSSSNFGGFLAVVGMFGIVVWALKK